MFLILCLCYVILFSFPICLAYSFFLPHSRSYSLSHSCFFSLYRFLSCPPLILPNWCSVSSFRALFIPLPFCAFIFFRAPFYILSFFVFGSFRALFHSTCCPPFLHRCCVSLSLCSCLYITLYDVAIGRSIAGYYCLIQSFVP